VEQFGPKPKLMLRQGLSLRAQTWRWPPGEHSAKPQRPLISTSGATVRSALHNPVRSGSRHRRAAQIALFSNLDLADPVPDGILPMF